MHFQMQDRANILIEKQFSLFLTFSSSKVINQGIFYINLSTQFQA